MFYVFFSMGIQVPTAAAAWQGIPSQAPPIQAPQQMTGPNGTIPQPGLVFPIQQYQVKQPTLVTNPQLPIKTYCRNTNVSLIPMHTPLQIRHWNMLTSSVENTKSRYSRTNHKQLALNSYLELIINKGKPYISRVHHKCIWSTINNNILCRSTTIFV